MNETAQTHQFTIIGAGAWGTTLSWLLANKGLPIKLWARRPEQAQKLQQHRENRLHLPGVTLPDPITVTAEFAPALRAAEFIIVAVPSAYLRQVLARAADHIPQSAALITATKGIEVETGKRMSQVVAEETARSPDCIMALSGPNLSGEIVRQMPATSVIAGRNHQILRKCQKLLSTPLFRVYTNCDILGVEICGAVKNIIAIAAGVCDGLGYGANTKAALLTRGLAETARLGFTMGAQPATFWGLAGVGDLIATCNSPLSRNYQAGRKLAKGYSRQQIISGQESIAEGIPTTDAVHRLAASHNVEMPIVHALYRVLFEDLDPTQAVEMLMTREWKSETEDWQ